MNCFFFLLQFLKHHISQWVFKIDTHTYDLFIEVSTKELPLGVWTPMKY